ncbi:DUF3179 domain-containing (seleno)protein [Halococcus saccharolyticus]|uniref:DUF3179 domain-containing protein n=1 Tax=Halococcus saccharolyticus DSM 5350 TaxID=1227455 RepID=M0MKR4_9EURY|nr:DUF3179 domain-containing (seleno)protein [Halococcus saccharolyticus]EMA46261.1 hypothetical protein C449_04490 [Halococcus saccharolyticus DSM 5350]
MNRRRFLTGVGTVPALGISGCLGGLIGDRDTDADVSNASTAPTDPGDARTTAASTTTEAVSIDSLAEEGLPSDVCTEEINEDFGIDAVTEPAFATDWSGIDAEEKYYFRDQTGLADEQTVIGLAGETPRAYPLSVLWVHEIVNDVIEPASKTRQASSGDDLAGPVIVTYCPLCQSGLVAERRVNGQETIFGVSGLLWQAPRVYEAASEAEGQVFGAAHGNRTDAAIRNNGNLVMYDLATRSYWSQILARAICGPQTGETLTIVPSSFTTWGEWRAAHPDTEVLLPPPHSGTI